MHINHFKFNCIQIYLCQTNIHQAVFVGSGFNFPGSANITDATETALYLYEPLGVDVGTDHLNQTGNHNTGDTTYQAGDLIKKMTVPDGVGGLSSPTIVDTNNDGVADVIYAGDYGGNMYRFDIRNPDPDKWTVVKIYAALPEDHSPITAAPAIYTYNPTHSEAAKRNIVVFGTGSELYQHDIQDDSQQYVIGIYDNPNESNPLTPDSNQQSITKTRKDLLAQLMSVTGSGRSLTQYQFPADSSPAGWYFALPANGERVVLNPQIASNTGFAVSHVFNVTKPDSNGNIPDPCDLTSTSTITQTYSWILQFNIRTGGALNSRDLHMVSDHPDNGNNAYVQTAISMEGLQNINISFSRADNGDGRVSGNNLGSSGKEPDLPDPNNASENNSGREASKCLKNSPIIVTSDATHSSFLTKGGLCSVNLRILSWHTVFNHYLF